MSKYAQHQSQLNKTTIYLQKKFPFARFFDQHVGKFYSPRIIHAMKAMKSISDLVHFLKTRNKFLVSINKPGMPDQYMLMPVMINDKKIPVFIPIETKTGSGRLSEDQKKWQRIYESMGCKYVVSRDEKEVEKEIQKYKEWIES